ncbi:hypothetical protein V8D89_004369 [Ganoderma adspersum]
MLRSESHLVLVRSLAQSAATCAAPLLLQRSSAFHAQLSLRRSTHDHAVTHLAPIPIPFFCRGPCQRVNVPGMRYRHPRSSTLFHLSVVHPILTS